MATSARLSELQRDTIIRLRDLYLRNVGILARRRKQLTAALQVIRPCPCNRCLSNPERIAAGHPGAPALQVCEYASIRHCRGSTPAAAALTQFPCDAGHLQGSKCSINVQGIDITWRFVQNALPMSSACGDGGVTDNQYRCDPSVARSCMFPFSEYAKIDDAPPSGTLVQDLAHLVVRFVLSW